jgi:hypothetical protein
MSTIPNPLKGLVKRFDAFLRRIFGTTRAERAERDWKNSLWLVIGVGAVALYLWAQTQTAPAVVFLGGVFIAAASAMVGALGGMIFGLPRSTPRASDANGSGGAAQSVISPNTNMIEISDWLTKIIVGLGLTQLGAIPGDFQRLVAYARGALGNPPGSEPIVGALILVYAVTGFVLTYLFTRTDLEAAIAAADASPNAQLDMLSQLSKLHDTGLFTNQDLAGIKKKVLDNISGEIG